VSAWEALRRLFGQPVPAADDCEATPGIPDAEKAAREAEVREYRERARAAEQLARIQAKER
jgi:hypothetical protein